MGGGGGGGGDGGGGGCFDDIRWLARARVCAERLRCTRKPPLMLVVIIPRRRAVFISYCLLSLFSHCVSQRFGYR